VSQAPLLYASRNYDDLGQRLAAKSQVELGEVEAREFPDGERYRRIVTPCRGRDVILLAGTVTDADTLALYDVACASVYYGARRLSILLPFFGYSTMERAIRPGEVVTAKTRARLLSSIPDAAMGNEIIMLDLHVEGITHYFEGSMQPRHLSARPLIAELARGLGGDDFVLACTDAGRAKWVEALANELGVACAFAYKRRLGGADTEVIGVSERVAGKKVVIYDDMIRTGSSLMGAAEAYIEAGATEVSALTTHGVFPGEALSDLRKSGLFAAIACTDSHPRARELADSFLQVHSIATLLADSLHDQGMRGYDD